MIYGVSQGECLSSIARQFGFSSFRTIYDHPKNADLRQLRPNPNVIFPGDRVFIPELDPKWEARATDARHRFRAKCPHTLLRVVAVDPSGTPLKGRPYSLTVGSKEHRGRTGSDGLIEVEIDADADRARLSIAGIDAQDPPFVRHLYMGHVDPISEPSGIQGRLTNLGFACAEGDGIPGTQTAALASFQRCHNLSADGALNGETRDRLQQIHGC